MLLSSSTGHNLESTRVNEPPRPTQRSRHNVNDYELIAVIGKGGYGEVRVVRSKETKEVFAMKSLLKKKNDRKETIKSRAN